LETSIGEEGNGGPWRSASALGRRFDPRHNTERKNTGKGEDGMDSISL